MHVPNYLCDGADLMTKKTAHHVESKIRVQRAIHSIINCYFIGELMYDLMGHYFWFNAVSYCRTNVQF